jgi:hypothetical protein
VCSLCGGALHLVDPAGITRVTVVIGGSLRRGTHRFRVYVMFDALVWSLGSYCIVFS